MSRAEGQGQSRMGALAAVRVAKSGLKLQGASRTVEIQGVRSPVVEGANMSDDGHEKQSTRVLTWA